MILTLARKPRLTAQLLLLSTAVLSFAAFGRELPNQFQATFALEALGITVAETRWSFSPGNDGGYTYESRTEPVGSFAALYDKTIVERSTGKDVEGWLQPLSYYYKRTGRKVREIDLKFDWQKGTGIARLDSQEIPVLPGTMDKLNYLLALMRDLNRGVRNREYTILDGAKLKHYVLQEVGEERIETELGFFDTVVIRRVRKNTTRETTIWFADELHFFPVKFVHMEPGGPSLSLRITALSGIEQR